VIHHRVNYSTAVIRQETEVAVEHGPCRGTGEEVRAAVIDVVDEEAVYRVGEYVGEQQPVVVDHVVPRLAHAAGGSEVAQLETAEYGGYRVVRQGLRVIHGLQIDYPARPAAVRFGGRATPV
jgi:hypothetical protein